MKIRLHFLLALPFTLLTLPSNCIAQSYYYVIEQGVDPAFNPFSGGSDVFSSPANEQFSTAQTIPFAFNFYGTPYTQYLISDNGYITFDLAAVSSDPVNTSIPNASGPNNSIYAFWDQLEISDNPSFSAQACRTYTVGTTPNRIHMIQFEAVPQGVQANAGYMYFAIRLHENGDFDILHQQAGPSAAPQSATAGCENATGTVATMIAGSPSLSYAGGQYLVENQIVYHFIYGTQPQYDVVEVNMVLPNVVHTNASYNLQADVINQGATTINSLTVEYQVDANPAVATTINGLSIATNGTYTFTHPTVWTPTNAGNYSTVSLRVTAVNGNPDSNPGNDTLEKDTWVNLGLTGIQNVLLEEFSTAPCGWCPDGDLVLQNLIDTLGDIIPITHHSGYLSDDMTTTESIAIAGAFAAGAPTATIDRLHYEGEINVAVGRNVWSAKINERLTEKTPLDITISNSLNNATRDLTIDVDLDFVDYAEPGDLRLSVFLTEDSVTGTGSGYDQTNFYNTIPGHPYYNVGDPIIGYVHDHVHRMSATGSWGDNTVITGNPGPGSTYSAQYVINVPVTQNISNTNIIAFVHYYDAANERPDVLNSNQSFVMILGVDEKINSAQINLFPNPASDVAYVEIEMKHAGIISASLLDISGKELKSLLENVEIPAGSFTHPIGLENLSKGVYLLEMNVSGEKYLKRLVID